MTPLTMVSLSVEDGFVYKDVEFKEFQKIARLSRECVITEKIDGTNAQIYIYECDGSGSDNCGELHMRIGSRTRWLSAKEDNHGFCKWAMEHRDELLKLGPGRHYGEWWGSGIQRGYGLPKGEKRLSLFNTGAWTPENVPACVSVVPVLYRGIFSTSYAGMCLERLILEGSVAAPGYRNPEGIIIYHTAAGVYFKKTIEKDEVPKSKEPQAIYSGPQVFTTSTKLTPWT